MCIPKNKLSVKRSTLPGAGKGLFTKEFIPKGTRIIEYTGTLTTWKDVDFDEGRNGYIYYVTRNHVIDAAPHPDAWARYANDAKGIKQIAGITNNAIYKEENKRVYITAVKDIPAGAEIFVRYGKEYWDVIRYNASLDKRHLRDAGRN